LFVVARVIIIIILGRSGGSDRSLLVKLSFMKTCRSSVPDFFSQGLSPFGVSILALGNTAILRTLLQFSSYLDEGERSPTGSTFGGDCSRAIQATLTDRP